MKLLPALIWKDQDLEEYKEWIETIVTAESINAKKLTDAMRRIAIKKRRINDDTNSTIGHSIGRVKKKGVNNFGTDPSIKN